MNYNLFMPDLPEVPDHLPRNAFLDEERGHMVTLAKKIAKGKVQIAVLNNKRVRRSYEVMVDANLELVKRHQQTYMHAYRKHVREKQAEADALAEREA